MLISRKELQEIDVGDNEVLEITRKVNKISNPTLLGI